MQHSVASTVLASAVLLAHLTATATAQVPGTTREQMWVAPTAEDWKKPCLLTFQRTWEDALDVSRRSGRPILVCVNMDGEIASEHYAGVRYRQPEMAALYEPYVCVIASVYRHTPRDWDEQGSRILCPRFGSVTCGEHIAIEPILYESYFDGQRVAPRHVMVELDREEVFDVFYAFDTDSVFRTIREGVEGREFPPDAGADRPLLERVASRDIRDRKAVEEAYKAGDRTLRRSILERLVVTQDLDQVDLLRLALFGFDTELAKLARRSLAQVDSEKAIDLIHEALRVPMEADERELLIAALERLGATWPRAATLASVQRGMAEDSGLVDVGGWAQSLAGASAQEARESYVQSAELAARIETARERAATPDEQLAEARDLVALALAPDTSARTGGAGRTAQSWTKLLHEDARAAALRAEAGGAAGWELDAVLAIASWHLEDYDTAYARAEQAMASIPEGAPGLEAMNVVAIFAEGRRRAIWKAVREKQEWPRQWLTDVHAAYTVLAVHPLGNDLQVVAHHDFLRSMGAATQAAQALQEGMQRFPDSAFLHDRLRASILSEKGVAALEPAYEALLARVDAPATLPWFAGYTSIVVAEFHRRAGDDTAALAAYERAIAHFDRSNAIYPDGADSADHQVALALAGRARLALERGDDEAAVDELLASFARRPMSAGLLDGLGLTAVATSQMLRSRLEAGGKTELLARLDAALAALDPEVFIPPAFETFGRDGRRRSRTR
jgi:tetratricopeptide (TPR) repeat protein